MSAGERVPLAHAQACAKCLMGTWGMTEPFCAIVGSVRRGVPLVGDLEFIAPAPAPDQPDALFDAMDRTMQTEGLFGEGTVPVAKPVKGFRRGFRSCSIEASLRINAGGEARDLIIPVQLYRYEHDGSNRGWIELMRTGPSNFGRWFLTKWKEHHGIPFEDEHMASVDGHLVDRWGMRVPVLTEHDAFGKCGLRWVTPAQRDVVAEQVFGARKRA